MLDSDDAGRKAKKKIDDLYLKEIAEGRPFRIFMLKETAALSLNEPAIEDIFPPDFYVSCVNGAYDIAIKLEDLPSDWSDQIVKRVGHILRTRFGFDSLDRGRVMRHMLSEMDKWRSVSDLPSGTAEAAERLFRKVNQEFAVPAQA